MIVGSYFRIFVIFSLLCESLQLWCLDGSDCEATDTCALCEGAACLRVQRNHPQKGVSIAVTCLPHDSLIHTYYPEGCRTEPSSGEKLCLCSNGDFCNSSAVFHNYFAIFIMFLTVFRFLL